MVAIHVGAVSVAANQRNATSASRVAGTQAGQGSATDVAVGGNVTQLDLTMTVVTNNWAGYYGDLTVSGLSIGTNSATLYQWPSPASLKGYGIGATTQAAMSFTGIVACCTGTNLSLIDSAETFGNTNENDTLVQTFGAVNSSGTFTGTTGATTSESNISANTSYAFGVSGVNLTFLNSGESNEVFPVGVMHDGGGATINDLLFVTAVNLSTTTGFDSTAGIEYSLIVPVNGSSETYYFFVFVNP